VKIWDHHDFIKIVCRDQTIYTWDAISPSGCQTAALKRLSSSLTPSQRFLLLRRLICEVSLYFSILKLWNNVCKMYFRVCLSSLFPLEKAGLHGFSFKSNGGKKRWSLKVSCRSLMRKDLKENSQKHCCEGENCCENITILRNDSKALWVTRALISRFSLTDFIWHESHELTG